MPQRTGAHSFVRFVPDGRKLWNSTVRNLFTAPRYDLRSFAVGRRMFREDLPIAYDAPADLKKWPSLNSQRVTSKAPYLVHTGTLADCIRELLAKPIKQVSLYDIVTKPQEAFDSGVISPGDAAEIAMRKDFPKD